MEKTLHLTLKKKWFDMIASGEKKEEYREIKRYWIQRLCNEVEYETGGAWEGVVKKFDRITFRNGYQKNAPEITVECLGIRIGKAVTQWSDNWEGDVFKILLGRILQS